MAQETLKITITADNKQAVQNIQETITATTQMGDAFNKVPATSRQATNALSNLSRVAQDAPYGFIGIANNLNPLLESFQRLQAESKATGTSLITNLVNALSGPAGLGLALAAISSLAVVFSDDLKKAFEGPADKLKNLREELKKLNDEIYKTAGSAQASQTLGTELVGRITNQSLDITQRQNALKKLKELYSNNKEIQALEIKDLTTYNAQFLQSLNNKAALQELEIGKEKSYINALSAANAAYKKLIEERDNLKKNTTATTKQLEMGTTTEMLRSQIDAQYIKPLQEAQKDIDKAKASLSRTLDVSTLYNTKDSKSGGTKQDEKDPFEELTKDFDKSLRAQETLRSRGIISQQEYFDNVYKIYQNYINKLAELDTKRATDKIDSLVPKFDKMTLDKNAKEIKDSIDKILGNYKETPMEVPKDTSIEDAKKQHDDYLKWLTDWTKWKEDLALKNIEKEKDKLKELQQSYERFAQMIANTVTNALFTMFDAMQQGENPLQAIGQMFANIGRQIAAAVVQALIFKALLEAFPALKGVFTAIGGAGDGIGSLLGLASGGVVTGPTLAMIGEGSESEAVLPLSKLGGMLDRTFAAGSMSGNQTSGNSAFVLRGQDLLLSINRAQKASNLKGQNISLA